MPINCVGEWKSSCDKDTGRLISILDRKIVQAQYGGIDCPQTKDSGSCPVDCTLNEWSAWSQCDPITGTQTRTTTVKYPSKNGGTSCPATTQTQNCPVNCVPIWDNGVCKNTGKLERTLIGRSVTAKNGGLECQPTNSDITCDYCNGRGTLSNGTCNCNSYNSYGPSSYGSNLWKFDGYTKQYMGDRCQYSDEMCLGDYDCDTPNQTRWGSINNDGQCYPYDNIFNNYCYNS
jgi:hypothetical protein